MIYVLLSVAGVCVVAAAFLLVRRAPQGDDVERFHRARAMTTAWSRSYAADGHPAPPPAPIESPPGRDPEPAERR